VSLEIDLSDITLFANALTASTPVVRNELLMANRGIVSEGIGIAQEKAPIEDGGLRNSIGVIGDITADGGSFGTSLIYAWQREEGGTIHGNPWLVFQVNGRWVKVRSVTQVGTHYMRNTVGELEPIAMVAWGKAIERAWEKVG
jgi:hypothetical protein